MKLLGRILLASAFTIGTFSTVLYTSCNKSKCGSTTCQNGGVCSDNVCICPAGYSGNGCQTGWSDPAVGTYNCLRTQCIPKVGGDSTWQSAVVKAATNGGYTIDISNFDKSNITVVATIDSPLNGHSKIQISPASGTAGLQASGYYDNGVVMLNFTSSAVGGVGGYTCKMVMTKL